MPSVSPTLVPTVQPSVVPSLVPSVAPSLVPTAVVGRTTTPTMVVTSSPTIMPSIARTEYPAPRFRSISVVASRTTASVAVTLSSDGVVYCGIYGLEIIPSSVEQIILQNRMGISYQNETSIELSGLDSMTSYSLYCASKSSTGNVMSLDEVVRNQKSFSTGCCRTVSVKLTANSVASDQSMINFITLTVDTMPTESTSMLIDLWQKTDDNKFALSSSSLVPSSINMIGSSVFRASLPALQNGVYGIAVKFIGGEAYKYAASYSGSTMSITTGDDQTSVAVFDVVSTFPPLDPPSLQSAKFSNDGSYITIRFSAASDRAGTRSSFACSELFAFSCAELSRCQWDGFDSVIAYVASRDTCVTPGQSILLTASAQLRAKCPAADGICPSHASWLTATTGDVSIVTVAAPDSPVRPTVVVIAPSRLGSCSNLVMDLTSSTGNGGRSWSSYSVEVAKDPMYDDLQSSNRSELQRFFDSQYQMLPPTAAPYSLLTSNRVYSFKVALCNYLGTCSQSAKYVEVASSIVPVVTIPGLSLRTMKRSSVLSIGSKGSISRCDETSTAVAISYTWTISRGDTVLSLSSTSKDPSKLVLPAYSLQANALYTVAVSATADGQTAQSSTQVYVTLGDLIAVVKGGTTSRTVRVGESLSLDASASMDEDLQGVVGTAAGLSFAWSCTQLQPSLVSSCSGIFDDARFALSANSSVADLKVNSEASAGSVAQLELLISSGSRTTTSTITITIVSPISPTLTLLANAKSGRMNANQNLQLTGTVSLPSSLSGNITWSLDESDADVSLSAVSLSPLSVPVTARTESDPLFSTMRSLTLYLSIRSNKLTVGSSYSFFLACSVGSATTKTNVQVTVNSPPTPGVFTVSPSEGFELQDTYTFLASRFQDTDLPLMYEYKYYSSSGNLVTIRSLSEAAIGSTILPAGVATLNYAVVCVGDVYDSMMANTTNLQSVKVKVQPALDQAKITNLLSSSLSNLGASNNVDDIKQASSVGLYLLNKVNCTLAPDCKSLNRNPCSRQSHTCGSCFSYTEYFGVEGDSNEVCTSIKSLSGSTADFLNALVTSGKPKSCINDCSGHGQCQAYSSTTHSLMNTTLCYEGSLTCYTACDCEEDYSSSISCSLSKAEMEQKIQFRESMIMHLASLTSLEDPSDQSVQSLLSSLSEASQAKDELSKSSVDAILSTISNVMSQVASAGLSVSSTESVASLLDNVGGGLVLQVQQSKRRRRNRRRLDESTEVSTTQADSLTGLLQSYSTLLTTSMVPGQEPSDMVGSTYKFSAGVYESQTVSSPDTVCESSMAVTLPSKLSEQLLGVESHAIAVPSCSYDSSDSGSSRSISLISTSADLYDNDLFIGNPISVEMSSYPCSASAPEGCTIELLIPRNSDAITSLPEEMSNSDVQQITCEDGDYSKHFFDCPSTPGISIQCNGTYATVSATCPTITAEPSCSVLLSSNTFGYDNCKVVNYTATTVSCLCSLVGPIDTDDRKLLSNTSSHSFSSDDTVSVSYVSMLTAVTGSFVTTINSATKLNASVVAKGWQALVTLGTLLVFFLSAMTFAHFADDKVKKRIAVAKDDDAVNGEQGHNQSNHGQSHASRGSFMIRLSRFGSMTHRQSQIRPEIIELAERQKAKSNPKNRYMAMAEEALPKVLISSKSLTKRVIDEMKRHHRWIGVIYYFSKKFPRVLRIVSLATNIIVMLFIQSLTYDLTKGDDGSCESFKSEEACLEPKSQYSSSMPRCYWTYDDSPSAAITAGECHFVQPDNNFTVVIFVAVFSALVSTPVALFADWIIENVLSVPTAQESDDDELIVSKDGVKRQSGIAMVMPFISTSQKSPDQVVNAHSVVPAPRPSSQQKHRQALVGTDLAFKHHHGHHHANAHHLHHKAKALIDSAGLARVDFETLRRQMKEYRNDLIEESDRKEFDCKYFSPYCILYIN